MRYDISIFLKKSRKLSDALRHFKNGHENLADMSKNWNVVAHQRALWCATTFQFLYFSLRRPHGVTRHYRDLRVPYSRSLFPQHSTLGTSCSLLLFPQEFEQHPTLTFDVFHWELRFLFGRKERVVEIGKCIPKSSNLIANVNETCSKEVFRSGIEFRIVIQCHPLPKRSFVTDVCTKRQTTQVPIDSCYIVELCL